MKSVTLKEVIRSPGKKFIFHGDVENKGIVQWIVSNNSNPQIVNLVTGETKFVRSNALLNEKVSICT